jgi:hypothetical protein
MRKVIVSMSISLDGFVAPEKGAEDHRSAPEDPALKQVKLDWLRPRLERARAGDPRGPVLVPNATCAVPSTSLAERYSRSSVSLRCSSAAYI